MKTQDKIKTVKLSKDVHQLARISAAKEGVTMSDWVERAIRLQSEIESSQKVDGRQQ
jgi:predicted HicB family RNase H-like nuclease